MQSFHSYLDVADMDVKISFRSVLKFFGTLLPNDFCGRGYILLKNVSLHRFQNLCIRFVTVVQYEISFLYTYDTFFPADLVCFLHIFVSGLSCRKHDTRHSHIDEVMFIFPLESPFLFHPFHVAYILRME